MTPRAELGDGFDYLTRLDLPRTAGRPAQIARALGRRIVNGDLPPGAALPPEGELLDQMGVSRTTLREAFKILSAKGLVNPKPKVGTLVAPRAEWSMLDTDVLGWLFEGDGWRRPWPSSSSSAA